MGLHERNTMDYWNISRGALRKTTTEDDPQAKKRTYKDRQTGEEKTIHEIVYGSISGVIEDVKIVDSNFGKKLSIIIRDVDIFAVQMAWDSSEATSFCEKLRNVDITKEVEIIPYDFVPKGRTKSRRGVNIIQDGEKIGNYYIELDADGKFAGHKHGFPSAEGDTDSWESEDWKILFAQQRKFLRDNVVNEFPFIDIDEADEPQEEKKDDLPF